MWCARCGGMHLKSQNLGWRQLSSRSFLDEFKVILSYKENLRPVDSMRPYQKKKKEYRKGRKDEKIPSKQKTNEPSGTPSSSLWLHNGSHGYCVGLAACDLWFFCWVLHWEKQTMHLYLIQPKCLLLGGSYEAMPTDAKNFLFLVAFVEKRRSRWSEIQRMNLATNKAIVFRNSYGVKGILSWLYWSTTFFFKLKSHYQHENFHLHLTGRSNSPDTGNRVERSKLLHFWCPSGSLACGKAGASFVQKLGAAGSVSHVEEEIQTQDRNTIWPAQHTPSTIGSLHFIILRHIKFAKPRNELTEMLAVPRLGGSQGS